MDVSNRPSDIKNIKISVVELVEATWCQQANVPSTGSGTAGAEIGWDGFKEMDSIEHF